MNVLYVTMNGTRERVNFPVELDMMGKGCALFEASGVVGPYTDKPVFLCADFVEDCSIIRNKQMSILRRLKLVPYSGGKMGYVDQVFDKMLWLPTNINAVQEIRLYIIDDKGNDAPFQSCNISCTLVCIPNHNKI